MQAFFDFQGEQIKLTAAGIQNALNGTDWWLKDCIDSAIIKAAIEKGFVQRNSVTQAQWTQVGADHFINETTCNGKF